MPEKVLILDLFPSLDNVRNETQQCQQLNHKQQVAYSTYHDILTQICFTCKKVRTNLK